MVCGWCGDVLVATEEPGVVRRGRELARRHRRSRRRTHLRRTPARRRTRAAAVRGPIVWFSEKTLTGLDHRVVQQVGTAMDVLDAGLARRVLGGERRDLLDDAERLGPFGVAIRRDRAQGSDDAAVAVHNRPSAPRPCRLGVRPSTGRPARCSPRSPRMSRRPPVTRRI